MGDTEDPEGVSPPFAHESAVPWRMDEGAEKEEGFTGSFVVYNVANRMASYGVGDRCFPSTPPTDSGDEPGEGGDSEWLTATLERGFR